MARRRTDAPAPCGKKRLSESRAQGVVANARRSRNPNRQEQRVYFCRGCQCWHTASTPYLTAAQRYDLRP